MARGALGPGTPSTLSMPRTLEYIGRLMEQPSGALHSQLSSSYYDTDCIPYIQLHLLYTLTKRA